MKMPQKEMDLFWEEAKRKLQNFVSLSVIDVVFKDVRICDVEFQESVTLVTDSGYFYHIIDKSYRQQLKDVFAEIFGCPIRVNLAFDGDPTDIENLTGQLRYADTNAEEPSEILFKKKSGDSTPARKGDFLPKPRGSVFPASSLEYTFDNFIVGSSNKFAHAACFAVSEDFNSKYNPLFIHGQSGLGKTHLMYAVLNKIRQRSPGVNILYIKGEEFTNELVRSIQHNSMPQFREKFRSCDLLLIDDIQFIAGKESTQEEIFHTFNALYEDNKQIILTSDRPPKDMKTLEDRLKSRFEWGLIADVQPPDLELRVAILKKKCESSNLTVDDDIQLFLAENLRSNIRQLEGVVKKLSAMTFLSGEKITMQMAQNAIAEFIGSEEPVGVTIDRIFELVEQKFDVTKEELVSASRKGNIVSARHVAVYLISQVTDASNVHIGKIFNRHHTTVGDSRKVVEARLLSDVSYNFTVTEMIKTLKSTST